MCSIVLLQSCVKYHASPSAADCETAIRLHLEDEDIELTDVSSDCSVRAHFE